MSRTKARVISSLRMRRCSQRRKMTNCTATGTRVASQFSLCTVLEPIDYEFSGLVPGGPGLKPDLGGRSISAGLKARSPGLNEVRGFRLTPRLRRVARALRG